MEEHFYICIDLKSFYASCECVARNLDPFKTNLVVADQTRTEKTICLAVSPALKKLGIKGRCRLFEIPKNIKFIIAPPRMQHYINMSANIYSIYLKYVDKNDIFVYSIDEVFIEATHYLKMYKMSALELGQTIINDIFKTTGITATCGVGTNLYLAKISMDIMSKHSESNIAFLNEELYKQNLWNHKPLTDFWRIGDGISEKLAKYGITTMRQIASVEQDFLYKLFGVDAELLIDHANGVEPTTMQDIKQYESKTHSICSGQVLSRVYSFEEGVVLVTEMLDNLCLEMVAKNLVTSSITLHISYDRSLHEKSAHGTINLPITTSSSQTIREYGLSLYNKIMNKDFGIKKINLTFNNVVNEEFRQYDLLTNVEKKESELNLQKTILNIKNKYGKNSILRGVNYNKVGTMRERNQTIGGHSAGNESKDD